MKHEVVSREVWNARRAEALQKEKAMTRQRDALTAEIRALPWVKIEKDYVFQTADGPRTLVELFEGRNQLVIQHLMLGTAKSKPCPSCSFWADHFNASHWHLPARDTSFKVVSRAPLATIQEWKKTMDWEFDWVSSDGSTFNYDFGVTTPDHQEEPGISILYREGDTVYQTYFTTGRGLEVFNSTYNLLDLIPSGRNEAGLDFPMAWVKRHNEYAE